jgi:hypothetical protein
MLETAALPVLSDGDIFQIAQACPVLADTTLATLVKLVNSLRSHPVSTLSQLSPDLAPLQDSLDLAAAMAVAALRHYLEGIGAIEGEGVNFEALQGYCHEQLQLELALRRSSTSVDCGGLVAAPERG